LTIKKSFQQHNYFGNLVSPIWLSFTWLSEGFATLFERIVVDQIHPNDRIMEEFLINHFDTLLYMDVNDEREPLNRYVEDPSEFDMKFRYGVSFKGAAILRMFMEALGSETFLKGVTNYLTTMSFKSATPSDLHAGLQQAFNEDFPQQDVDIAAMMQPWENLPGFPVVTVRRESGRLVLTQAGFRTIHNELFHIPINYATASEPTFDDTRSEFWMTTTSMEILQSDAPKPWTNDDWIIVNLRDTGYYVTNYEDSLWDLIIQGLIENHDTIHFLNRGTLFADFNRFIHEGFDISSTIFLRLIQALSNENQAHVWYRAHEGLRKINFRFRGTVLHQNYLRYFRDIMTPVYNCLMNDENFNREIEDIVNFWSCTTGIVDCLDRSLGFLSEFMESGETSEDFTMLCNGFMTANENVFTHFLNRALQSSSQRERSTLLHALACTRNDDLLSSLMSLTLDLNNGLSQNERGSILFYFISENPVGYDLVFDFVEQNHEAIHR
jgi:aminopeptidase N